MVQSVWRKGGDTFIGPVMIIFIAGQGAISQLPIMAPVSQTGWPARGYDMDAAFML
jgi:hypothetical protein